MSEVLSIMSRMRINEDGNYVRTSESDALESMFAGRWIQNRAFDIIEEYNETNENSPLQGITNNSGRGADHFVSKEGVAFEGFSGTFENTQKHMSSHSAVGSGIPTGLIPYRPIESRFEQ
jgi:hypothetical protein